MDLWILFIGGAVCGALLTASIFLSCQLAGYSQGRRAGHAVWKESTEAYHRATADKDRARELWLDKVRRLRDIVEEE